MERPSMRPYSHLFTLRVWEEGSGTEQAELRGKVQLLTTGEVRYFRKWAGLVPLLMLMLSDLESDNQSEQSI